MNKNKQNKLVIFQSKEIRRIWCNEELEKIRDILLPKLMNGSVLVEGLGD